MEFGQKTMDITLEQQKLISNPLRVKIIYLLDEQSMTANIQQLFNSGILEIEETRENKGIIEKYYRSKATHFRLKDENASNQGKKRGRGSSLSLTDEELKEFEADFDNLLLKYLKKTVKEDDARTPYQVSLEFEKLLEEEEG